MKQLWKEISPLNNRTEMPTALFVVKKILAFWLCYYGVIGVANLILISILFSLLTIRFKGIWAACGLHSFWNAVLYCILGLNLSGNDETVAAVFHIQSVGENIWNGGVYGIEADVITTVVLVCAVGVIVWTGRRLL